MKLGMEHVYCRSITTRRFLWF